MNWGLAIKAAVFLTRTNDEVLHSEKAVPLAGGAVLCAPFLAADFGGAIDGPGRFKFVGHAGTLIVKLRT